MFVDMEYLEEVQDDSGRKPKKVQQSVSVDSSGTNSDFYLESDISSLINDDSDVSSTGLSDYGRYDVTLNSDSSELNRSETARRLASLPEADSEHSNDSVPEIPLEVPLEEQLDSSDTELKNESDESDENSYTSNNVDNTFSLENQTGELNYEEIFGNANQTNV